MRVMVIVAATLLFVAVCSHAQDIRLSASGVFQMEEKEDVTALAFSGSGTMLLAGDDAGGVSCWDLAKKIPLASAKAEAAVVFLAFLGGDRSYLAVDEDGNVTVYDLLKGATGTAFRTKGKPVRCALDAGRQFLAVATDAERIELYDVKALVPAGTIDARDKLEDVLFLGFDRLGQQLVAVMQLGDVGTWNPATLKAVRTMTLAGGELHNSRAVVHAASTNRATSVFAVALEEVALPAGGIQSGRDLERRNKIIAYDWNTGTEVKSVNINFTVERMALGPGSDHVAVTNDENTTITMVDLRKGELGSAVNMQKRPRVLSVSEDNRWLAAGADDGVVALWQMQFKDEGPSAPAAVPSLAGRIRSRSGTQPALTSGVPVKLAIVGFEAKGLPGDVPEVCMSSMANALANFDYITLVERKQIESIVKEQQFQLSGLTEDEGVSVGKILKADVVLLGNVGKLGTSMVFSARLISVETGKVIKGREVICEECRDQDMYDAITMLVSTIAQ